MKDKQLVISIFILFIISSLMLIFIFGNSDSNYGKYGSLYINEVSSTNFSIITDEDGDYSDYIEIYNGYDFDINLEGYHLSDKEYKIDTWTFPDVTIKSHEYLIVFASGKDKYDKYLHTNFKLKETGEVVILVDKDNTVLSKVKFSETAYNTSYGYNGRKYVYFYNGTPGLKNSGKTSLNTISFKDELVSIRFNEYIVNNKTIYDSDGDYYPVVELYNYGDKDINLNSYYLSDLENNLTKYPLPDIILEKNSYLKVYLSGKNKYTNNEIHTNFKIKDKEKLFITSPHGKIIDSIDIMEINTINVSYGLNSNLEWCFYPTPTFGYINNTKCFMKLGDINE